jgi:hypothetical protein
VDRKGEDTKICSRGTVVRSAADVPDSIQNGSSEIVK